MALVVENGTGLANAESYASVASADTYLLARGQSNWSTLTTALKEEALRRATDYMRIYRWKGTYATLIQALDWPRLGVYIYLNESVLVSSTIVPVPVQNACIELALRAASGPLIPEIAGDSTGRLATKIRKRVGPIETETMYASEGQISLPVHKRYPSVDLILAQYIQPKTSSVYR